MLRILFAATFALGLPGCATRYQEQGLTGGFTDLKFSADVFQITVKGNGYTSQERARDIALLRAADLAIREGAERFLIEGGTRSSSVGFTPITANRFGGTVIVSGGDEIRTPSGTFIVRLVRKADPAYAGAYDAQLIAAQLRPRLT